MSDGELTLHEIARTLGRMEAEINRRLADLAQAVTGMVSREVHDVRLAAMQKDIDDVRAELAEVKTELRTEKDQKSNHKRSLVLAVVAAVLSLIVSIVAPLIIFMLIKGG
jgi:acyl-CoA reductase-like NAD-dependent aldehyde dehydrogenase